MRSWLRVPDCKDFPAAKQSTSAARSDILIRPKGTRGEGERVNASGREARRVQMDRVIHYSIIEGAGTVRENLLFIISFLSPMCTAYEKDCSYSNHYFSHHLLRVRAMCIFVGVNHAWIGQTHNEC